MEAKEQCITDQCATIGDEMSTGNSKVAYNTLKLLTKPHQSRTTVVEDKRGNLLTEESAIIKRWTEYCSELYNSEIKGDPTALNCCTDNEEDNYPNL